MDGGDKRENGDACILCGARTDLRALTASGFTGSRWEMFPKQRKVEYHLCGKCLREQAAAMPTWAFVVFSVFAVAMLLWAVVLMAPASVRWNHPWIPGFGVFIRTLVFSVQLMFPLAILLTFRTKLARSPFFKQFTRVAGIGLNVMCRMRLPNLVRSYVFVCGLLAVSVALQWHCQTRIGNVNRWSRVVGRVNAVETKTCGGEQLWKYDYAYRVDGVEHHGTWVDTIDALHFQHTECVYRAKLAAENDVMVFYNPKNHGQSALTKLTEVPIHFSAYVVVVALAFALCTILFVINVGKRLDERHGGELAGERNAALPEKPSAALPLQVAAAMGAAGLIAAWLFVGHLREANLVLNFFAHCYVGLSAALFATAGIALWPTKSASRMMTLDVDSNKMDFRRVLATLVICVPLAFGAIPIATFCDGATFLLFAGLIAAAVALTIGVAACLCFASRAVRRTIVLQCGSCDRYFKRTALWTLTIGFVAFSGYFTLAWLRMVIQ